MKKLSQNPLISQAIRELKSQNKRNKAVKLLFLFKFEKIYSTHLTDKTLSFFYKLNGKKPISVNLNDDNHVLTYSIAKVLFNYGSSLNLKNKTIRVLSSKYKFNDKIITILNTESGFDLDTSDKQIIEYLDKNNLFVDSSVQDEPFSKYTEINVPSINWNGQRDVIKHAMIADYQKKLMIK